MAATGINRKWLTVSHTVGGAGDIYPFGGIYADGLFVNGYAGGGVAVVVGAGMAARSAQGNTGGGGSSFGPQASVVLPTPANPYVQIIPRRGGQTRPPAG